MKSFRTYLEKKLEDPEFAAGFLLESTRLDFTEAIARLMRKKKYQEVGIRTLVVYWNDDVETIRV